MRLNSGPIYLVATALLSFFAVFLVHRHAQLRLRWLNDGIQARAQEISKLQDEQDRLADLFRKEARTYGYADGSASRVESDDDFKSWDAQCVIPPGSSR